MTINLVSPIIKHLQRNLEKNHYSQMIHSIEAHLLTSTTGHRIPYETGMTIVETLYAHTHLPSSEWQEALTILITYNPVSACHLLLPFLKHSQEGITLINTLFHAIPEEDHTNRHYIRLSQLIQALEEES